MNLRNGAAYGNNSSLDDIRSKLRSKSNEMKTKTEPRKKCRNLTSDAIPIKSNSQLQPSSSQTEPNANYLDSGFVLNRSNYNSFDYNINQRASSSLQAESYRIKRECLDVVERTRLQHNLGAQHQNSADASAVLHNNSTRSLRVPKFIRDTAKPNAVLKIALVDVVKSKQVGKIEKENGVKDEIKKETPAIKAPRRSERLRTKPRINVLFDVKSKSEKKTGRKRQINVPKVGMKVKQEPSNAAFEIHSHAITEVEELPTKPTLLMPKDKELSMPSFLARRTNLPKKKELSEAVKDEVATNAFGLDHNYSRPSSLLGEDPALTNGTTLNDNEPKAALPYPQRLMSSMPPTEESSDSFQSISDDEDDNNGEMAIQDRKPIAIDVRSASWRVKASPIQFNYKDTPGSPDSSIEDMDMDDGPELPEENEDCAASLPEYSAMVRQKYMESIRSKPTAKSVFDLQDSDAESNIDNDNRDNNDDVESLFGDMSYSENEDSDNQVENEPQRRTSSEAFSSSLYAPYEKKQIKTLKQEGASASQFSPIPENNMFNSSMPTNIFGYLSAMLEQQVTPAPASTEITKPAIAPRRVLYSREIFGNLCEQFLKGTCSEDLFCLHTHQLPTIECVRDSLTMAAIDVVNEAFSNILISNEQLCSEYFGVFAEFYGIKKERRQLQIMLQYCKDPEYNLFSKLKDVVDAFVASGMEYHSVIDLILAKFKIGIQPADYHYLLEIIVDERNTNAGIHCNCKEFKDILYRNDYSFVVDFLDRIIALAIKKRNIDLMYISTLSLLNCTVITFKSLNPDMVEQFLVLCTEYKTMFNEASLKSIQARFDQFLQLSNAITY